MRIDGSTFPNVAWRVERDGKIEPNVVWVDDETLTWSQWDTKEVFAHYTEVVHRATSIEVDFDKFIILIDKGRPAIPPEVHNKRAVDADKAMAAVRAMCGDAQ